MAKRVLIVTGPRSGRAAKLVLLAVLSIVSPAAAQNTGVRGSVPSGPASNEVLRLTLRDAINMALRYNLGAIESGENAQITRELKTEQMALHLQQSFIGTMLLWSLRGEEKLQMAVEASFQHFWRAIAKNGEHEQ